MFVFVWKYIKKEISLFFVVSICSILLATADLAFPYLTAKFIDEILIVVDKSGFYSFIIILIIMGFSVVVANWFNHVISTKIQIKTSNEIIEDIIRHVHKLSNKYIIKTDMIYLAKRIENDVNSIIVFIITSLSDICINFVLLCLAFLFLWSVGIKWAVIFLIVAFIHTISYILLEKNLFNCSMAVREADSQYFTALSDNFLYVYSIKLHSLYEEYIKEFTDTFKIFFIATMRETKINFWFVTSNLNSSMIFRVIIFLLGGIDVFDEQMTIGVFVALNEYYFLAMQSFSYFMKFGQGYQNALAAYSRIIEIKDMPIDSNGNIRLNSINEIYFKDVTFAFSEIKLFENFSQDFRRGKIYCLVGKNGSGKTTLINLICGLLIPEKGTIKFNGIDIKNINMIVMRKDKIAVVEQKDFLKNDTLSGGERRKISIRTALIKNADVLIMDEPDNNLDVKGINELLNQIVYNKKNCITIIISHDDKIIAISDEVINFNRNEN